MAKKEAKVKRPRTRVKRERKLSVDANPEDRTWVHRSRHRAMAVAILNNSYTFSFWASMEKDGRALVAGYYPACHFEADGRVYYGFAFRHHRQDFIEQQVDARKEYTEIAQAKYRSVRR